MKNKHFLSGYILGIITAIIAVFVWGMFLSSTETNTTETTPVDIDPVHYFEQPESYENKKETSFKVFQVFSDRALANEISNKEFKLYSGNVVLILGNNFYDGQIVTVKYPQIIGTYSYTAQNGIMLTVPVFDIRE